MENEIDLEKFRIKRGPGRPKQAEVMPQISLRLPAWILDEIDAIIEHELHGQSDRATVLRQCIAKALDDRRKG